MDENEMNNMEEDIIDFEDEDGNVIPFAVIDYVFYNGEEYALLTEVTEEEAEEGRGLQDRLPRGGGHGRRRRGDRELRAR